MNALGALYRTSSDLVKLFDRPSTASTPSTATLSRLGREQASSRAGSGATKLSRCMCPATAPSTDPIQKKLCTPSIDSLQQEGESLEALYRTSKGLQKILYNSLEPLRPLQNLYILSTDSLQPPLAESLETLYRPSPDLLILRTDPRQTLDSLYSHIELPGSRASEQQGRQRGR